MREGLHSRFVNRLLGVAPAFFRGGQANSLVTETAGSLGTVSIATKFKVLALISSDMFVLAVLFAVKFLID